MEGVNQGGKIGLSLTGRALYSTTCDMPQDEKHTSIPLPVGLRHQFEALRSRLLKLESILAISIIAAGVLAGFILVFISDRLWDTPAWVRFVLFAASCGLALAAAGWWVWQWTVKKRDLRDLALVVQRKHRRLGDRLLGVVELSSEEKRPAYFSPELYQAAITQVAEQSSNYDFTEALSGERTRRYGMLAMALGVFTLVPFLVIPQAGWNALKRLFLPGAKIARWTLVELNEFPREIVVPHGEPFEISGKATYRSFWKPVRLRARYAAQNSFEQKVTGGSVMVAVPGQVTPGQLEIRLGDTRHIVSVKPTHRPALTALSASVQLPDYLQYPPVTENGQSGSITVLEGSKVALTAQVSREIESASITTEETAAMDLRVEGNKFHLPSLEVAQLQNVTFNWRDKLALTNAQPWRLDVQVEKDVVPAPGFPELFRDTSILETEVMPIKVRGQDDYGVKTIGLVWERPGEGTNSPVLAELKQDLTNHNTKSFEYTFSFSPAIMGLPADSSIEIRSFATDYFPGRPRSESPSYRIHILGTAQHAEMVRQNLESLLVHLEEVTRMEERIASETTSLSEIGKLDTPEAGKKIDELQKGQEQNAKALKEIAEEGMKSLREALRNPAFSEELLSQWTKDLFEMQKLADQEMKKASQSLASASKSQKNQDQRQKNLQEAAAKQDEVLQKLQEMQAKVNKGLDEMQALTLSQRLRKVAGDQKKIEEKLQNNIVDTIGLQPKELPGRYQKANELFAASQQSHQGETVKLQGEISRFFERTQRPNYGEVSKEMTDSHTAEELERVRVLIQDNIGMEAMQNLADWAGRMIAWADKLEPEEDKSEQSGSGEGAGSGEEEQENAALKQLMALLRMREKQANIQGRTRLLNERVEEKETWRDGAVLLAASQGKLNSDITKQAIENPYAILDSPYEDAMGAMSDVETLLDTPRTDQVTTTAQDKSVAMLSDIINILNEQAKQKSNSKSQESESAAAAEMDFLMQMMGQEGQQGMSQAPQPGKNQNGGTTDKAGSNVSGNMEGGSETERGSRRSSGVPQDYPMEFREALEGYFRALEADSK